MASTDTLADRVRALVRAEYPEGVKYAAGKIGIPQPTLQLIVSGASQNPRARTLQQIARHFDTTVGWLLNGEGPVPAVLTEDRPFAELEAAVARAGLDQDTAILLQGVASWWSEFRHALRLGRKVGDVVSPTSFAAMWEKRREAQRAIDRALALELDAFVIEFGAERAREQLRSDAVCQNLTALIHPVTLVEAGLLEERQRRRSSAPAAKPSTPLSHPRAHKGRRPARKR